MHRSLVRWLVVLSCALFAWLSATPAHAAAPICDERGASAIAPPPILPVRDDKLEGAPAVPLCVRWEHEATSIARNPSGPTPDSDSVPLDGSTLPGALAAPRDEGSAKMRRPADVPSAAASGHTPGVYHPPRA